MTTLYLRLHSSVHSAEKIRIGFPEFNSSTFTLAHGDKSKASFTKKRWKPS